MEIFKKFIKYIIQMISKIPAEIIINISFFLGSSDHYKLDIVLNKNTYQQVNYLISRLILSKNVLIKNNNLLIQINPRWKISFSINEKIDALKIIEKIFFSNTNIYYNHWLQNL